MAYLAGQSFYGANPGSIVRLTSILIANPVSPVATSTGGVPGYSALATTIRTRGKEANYNHVYLTGMLTPARFR